MKNMIKRFLSITLVITLLLSNSISTFASESANGDTEDSIIAQNTTTGKSYDDIAEALNDASEEDTITLLKDVSTSIVSITDNVELDLNGHTLEASYVACFGDIVDQSVDKTGYLKVEKSRLLIQEQNEQIPVKDEDGYRFFDIAKFNTKYQEELCRYVFQPFVEQRGHELINEGSTKSGITINVRVSWTKNNSKRTQDFVYSDEMVGDFFESYYQSDNTDKYKKMFTLVLNGIEGFSDLTFHSVVKSDTGVEIMSLPTIVVNKDVSESGNVTTDENNQVVEDVTIQNGADSANVSIGTQLEENADTLSLNVSEMDVTTSDIELEGTEQLLSVDVHVEGVSTDNTVPIIITLDKFAPEYMNKGNIKLYHVENGKTVEMTRVYSLKEVDVHNEFYYDTFTGTVTMALATFSEIAVVSDEENVWNGEVDTDWYNGETENTYTICNADQLAGLGQLVAEEKDFSDKTVKLIGDVNMGGEDVVDKAEKLMFYPIGYTSEGYKGAFSGTFDGTGHTISNIYQNTWMLVGTYDGRYYNDAMGLFGYVYNGTIKNLNVKNFQSDGEFTPTGCIAAYADNATFENIAITNCNPRVYNTGNGGIVGIGGNSDDTEAATLTFNNITIDNSNKITALWGSWDVACGGLVGMFRGAGHVYMTNCHVAAQMDVYNDVCGNYQYYWYRYSGMMIGTNKNMTTDANGYTVPETSKFHAENCTVHFGEWNDYYYCELVANSLASYTHDHQFSRLTPISSLDEIKDGDTWTEAGNYLLIEGDTKTCYHIMKSADGKLYQHKHDEKDSTNPDIYEEVNGENVLKEDKQIVYLPFNQLFTGYGWGVKHIPVYNGEDYAFEGITILDREVADSVVKFEKAETSKETYISGEKISVGELFSAAEQTEVPINMKNVQITVSPVGENSTAGGTYTPNLEDWTEGILKFSGSGIAEIIITDYNFCTPTVIKVEIVEQTPVDKFETKFENTDTYLYRVGNMNTVALGSLFKAKDGAQIGNVDVKIEALNGASVSETYTANTTDWTKGTLKFEGTGPVKVTVTDNDYCNPTELCLEVVDAKNITVAESATSNNVVLLNDINGTFSVSNGYSFYGNGFTVKLPTASVQNTGNGFTGYISIGAAQDSGIANGGHLDNVRIEGPVYPEMYIYRDQAKITDTSDADYGDGYNMRYFKNSVIIYGGNCTISNSYISGSRTALCLRGGNNVVIDNTTLSGGSYANMQICAGSNVTLRDLTTVQTDVTDSYGKDKTAHGLGIAVDSNIVDIYIEGELKQYNWLNESQWDEQVPSNYQSSFPDFFGNDKYDKYWHYLNGGTDPYVNLAFIYACNWDTSKIHDNRTKVDYETCESTIAGVDGGVYSKINTIDGNAIADTDIEGPDYKSPGYEPVAPVFDFDNTGNYDADDANDAADTYCVYEEGTLKIGVTGESKSIDLSGVSVTKNGATLGLSAYLNESLIKGDEVTIKAADGTTQTLTFKATSDAGYDKNGNPIEGEIEYIWTVNVEVAVLAYPAPVWNMGGTYKFDTSNCYYAYYQTSQGYGEAVPIYEGIKVNYYNKSGTLVELDLSGTTTLPTGSENANANAFTYTLADGSTLTMKYSSGWKSGATTHQFTAYNSKAYIYPQSLDNDSYVRAKTTNQDFDVKITYTFTDPNGQSTETVTMNWYNAAADNKNVKTEQWETFDSTNGKKPECVTPDTIITLADGTQVRADSLTGSEELLVWNMTTGSLDSAPIMFVDSESESEFEIVHLYFSDGTDVKVISEHGFWDYDLNKYVYLDRNAESYIGHEFAKQDGDRLSRVKLADVVIETEITTAWSPVTESHLCYFVNGMLSMPGGVGGLFNIFDVDSETMMYDFEAMERDINTYGLFTYEELNSIEPLSQKMFEEAGGAYLKISIGKGNMTMDELRYMIRRYSNYFE